jgi:hypothetical protein
MTTMTVTWVIWMTTPFSFVPQHLEKTMFSQPLICTSRAVSFEKGKNPMSQKELPASYTDYVPVQLADKRWYPLQVTQLYTADYQDGFLAVSFVPSLDGVAGEAVSFSHRKETAVYCQEQTARERQREQKRWEAKAVASNVYPERCAHYSAMIEKITGYSPLVRRFYDEVSVYIPEYPCEYGAHYHASLVKYALTIEEALEACAESIYANHEGCACTCSSQEIVLSSMEGIA